MVVVCCESGLFTDITGWTMKSFTKVKTTAFFDLIWSS